MYRALYGETESVKYKRLNHGGRLPSLPATTIVSLKTFFDNLRTVNYSVSLKQLQAETLLIDPVSCKDLEERTLAIRLYCLLKKWDMSYRRGTHKAQLNRHSVDICEDFV